MSSNSNIIEYSKSVLRRKDKREKRKMKAKRQWERDMQHAFNKPMIYRSWKINSRERFRSVVKDGMSNRISS